MAAKTTFHKTNLVTAGATSSGFNSDSTDMLGLDKVSYQLVVTGTTVSVATIQVSNDNSNWVSSSVAVTLAGSAGKIVELETSFRYVRLSVSANGTATVDVHICGKSM